MYCYAIRQVSKGLSVKCMNILTSKGSVVWVLATLSPGKVSGEYRGRLEEIRIRCRRMRKGRNRIEKIGDERGRD